MDPLYVDTALIGLPSEVMMPCFYYNKAILEECGVQLPETYDDLKTIIPTLIDKGYIPISKRSQEQYMGNVESICFHCTIWLF